MYAVGRNVRALAALAGQVGEEGATIATDITDISDPGNAPSLIGRAIGVYGHVDILVNNAGAAASGPIAMQTDEARSMALRAASDGSPTRATICRPMCRW